MSYPSYFVVVHSGGTYLINAENLSESIEANDLLELTTIVFGIYGSLTSAVKGNRLTKLVRLGERVLNQPS